MTKKYCVLEKLDMLGACKHECQSCSWLMSKTKANAYIARTKKEVARIEKLFKYSYSRNPRYKSCNR